MADILYTLLIFPIEQIIELSFVFVYRIFRNPAFSILGVSLAVSLFTLPLYFMAEKHQKTERDIQKKMKPAIDNIRSVFTGDERFMLLSAYYRQNSYHPLYSLRTSISLLIQIPFFIAAYHFLSNLEMIKCVSFGPIKDMSAPDALLTIGGFSVNILPIAMTLINIISAFIYTKGLSPKEKVQLYGMAAVFLVLLYNSPSGLVLYWTGNNLFSLFKNIIQKTKNAKKTVYAAVCLILIPVSVYVLFFHKGALNKRVLILGASLAVLLLPFLKIIFNKIKQNINFKLKITRYFSALCQTKSVFMLTITGLFLLIGYYIPTGLIATSVAEFSFIEPFSSPLPYIGLTMLQCAGFSLLIVSIYFLFETRIKNALTVIMTVIYGMFLFNTLTFTKEYGIMTADLMFEIFEKLSNSHIVINILLLTVICLMTIILLFLKKKIILITLQIIFAAALFSIGTINIAGIVRDFNNEPPAVKSDIDKIFTLSKTEKNVIVIVLDRAVSGYLPHIFEEKPEITGSYNGFVYYPNTVSPGRFSLHGLPSVFGGYYYTPYKIHNRLDQVQMDKIREAIQIMPRIFADNNFLVNAEHLPYITRNSFDKIKNIKTGYNNGAYTADFTKKYDIVMFDYYKLLYSKLIRFSIFKASPVILHNFIYDLGNYLSVPDSAVNIPKDTITNYSFLYNLPDITEITEENSKHALIIFNELPHAPFFLELPDYIPSNNVINRNEGMFGDENNYHVNMASILLLAKWFDYLRENDVYDNTRIIIASDHGNSLIKPLANDFQVPNERWLRYFNSLLMVKEFGADFEFKTDYSFMTISDVPHIASEGLIENLINPFNGKELLPDKENGYIVTSSMDYRITNMRSNRYNIKDNEWLHVHTNIFEPSNWSLFTP